MSEGVSTSVCGQPILNNPVMKRRKQIPKIVILVIILGIVASVTLFLDSRFNPIPSVIHSVTTKSEDFPEVDLASLTPLQHKVLVVLHEAYDKPKDGSQYSEGSKEPWCANFVSWVMKESGIPLANPHSQTWRIPGTITMREYYQSVGRFETATSGYQPKLGDVVFYDNPGVFGQHVNFVLKNDNGMFTTVGGNEGGHIRIWTNTQHANTNIIGFGRLER